MSVPAVGSDKEEEDCATTKPSLATTRKGVSICVEENQVFDYERDSIEDVSVKSIDFSARVSR